MAPCKILVIDDDDDTRETLVGLLIDEGFEAEGALSGAAALSRMDGFVPDAILLDHFMPVMNGEQFRAAVQAHPAWARIPIIVCTGDTVPQQVAAAVFCVLQKPFDLEQLLAVMKRACARPQPA